MIAVRRLLLGFIAVFSLAGMSFAASASNIYITQNGSPAGNCKSNVQSAAWLNSPANWGSGATQVGPGTTVLLCGTFTFPANSSGVTVQGSGSSTNPITIKFDTNAILQSNAFAGFGSSAFGAAILINGQNYVTVDGQNTGVVQNLLNGTPGQSCLSGTCSVQQTSLGVYLHNTTGVEVKNLTIHNLYMDKNGEQDGGGGGAAWESADIYTDGPNNSLAIDGNTLSDSHVGAWISFDNGSSSVNLFNNTINHHGWQISAANGTSCSNSMTISIYGNELYDWSDWNAAGAASYHTDGIISYTHSNGCTAPKYNPLIYNNYFHGDIDGGTGSGTAHIFCTNDTDGSTSYPNSTCTAFNNVIDQSLGGNTHCAASFWIAAQGAQVYNNTSIAPSSCSTGSSVAVELGANSKALFQNNIFVGFNNNIQSAYGSTTGSVGGSDHSVWYNCTGNAQCFNATNGNWTFSQWPAQTGNDVNSTSASPNLNNSTYLLGSSSSAISLGTNLTSLGITALNSDKAGNPRPATGAWDAGAYVSATNGTVAPPTGLTATVN